MTRIYVLWQPMLQNILVAFEDKKESEEKQEDLNKSESAMSSFSITEIHLIKKKAILNE